MHETYKNAIYNKTISSLECPNFFSRAARKNPDFFSQSRMTLNLMFCLWIWKNTKQLSHTTRHGFDEFQTASHGFWVHFIIVTIHKTWESLFLHSTQCRSRLQGDKEILNSCTCSCCDLFWGRSLEAANLAAYENFDIFLRLKNG